MRAKAFYYSIALSTAISAQANFFLPTWHGGSESENYELAWWNKWTGGGFVDPYTEWHLPDTGETVPEFPEGEGNLADYDNTLNTNRDALLIQNESQAIIAGSGGIYSHAGPMTFVIHDDPAYEAGSILLQTRYLSIGTPPDMQSARLFYRTEENGDLLEAGSAIGSGLLYKDDSIFAAWEWDLSAFTVYDYFIQFSSVESSMSLQEAVLATTDVSSRQLDLALDLQTNSAFAEVGTIQHKLEGASEPQLSYKVGDQIELTAEPGLYLQHVFSGWGGNASGTENPLVITMEEGSIYRAIFSPLTYQAWAWNSINDQIPDIAAREAIDADPDSDGWTNLLEYALGGAPETSDEEPVQPQASISTNGSYLQITFRRQPAATDLDYTVMVSDDLQNWHYNNDGSGTYTEIVNDSISLNDDGTETVTVRDLTPLPANGARFMIVEVTKKTS